MSRSTLVSAVSAVLLSAVCSLVAAAGPAEPQPCAGIVNRDAVPVLSGPSTRHYTTSSLDRGDRVEVYRIDDGWLAVRPPRGSFSWVRADQIRMTERPRIGAAVEDGVEVLIGGEADDLSALRCAVHLRLSELVEVIGQRRAATSDTDGEMTWFKIHPPSGEFRWIEAGGVDPVEPGAFSQVPSGRASTESSSSLADLIRESSDDRGDSTGIREVTSEAGRFDRVESDAGPRRLTFRRPTAADATAAADRSDQATDSDLVAIPSSADSRRSDPDGGHRSSSISDELDRLDVELSLTVSRSTDQWDLEGIRRRVEQLRDRGETTLDRGRASLLLERIEEFADLLRRQRDLSSGGGVVRAAATTPSSEPPAAVGTGVAADSSGERAPTSSSEDADGKGATEIYDTAGFLLPVKPSRPTTPPYAIVGSDRKVLSYVSPAPGLNLHRYLHRRVGIYGQQQEMPGLRTRHVTAERVIDLNRHRAFFTARRDAQ